MEPSNLNREELYELVWAKTLGTIATECGITASVLRQVCIENLIPVPSSGDRSAKDSQKRRPLPANEKPTKFDFNAEVAAATSSLHFPGESTSLFHVCEKLINPDVLIVRAQRTLRQDYHFYELNDMLGADLDELSIRASKKNIDRALRIMDTLIKVWRSRNYQIIPQGKKTRIEIRKVSNHISLREITKVLPGKGRFASRVHEATGRLAFRFDGWQGKEWTDGKTLLENQLQEITDYMEVSARDLEKTWENNKVAERKRKEKEQALIAQILDDAQESDAFEVLLKEAQRWNEFNVLDKYLDFLSRSVPYTPAFQQWLQWARSRYRIFDPSIKRRSEFEAE